MKLFLIWLFTVVCWCVGGQGPKWVRRYLLPLGLFGFLLTKKNKKDEVKAASILSLTGVNSMGYGENSKLMSIFKLDWLVRLAYSILVSLPFILLLQPLQATITTLAIVGAFQLRLGGLNFKHFDILYEDIARGTAVSIGVILALL